MSNPMEQFDRGLARMGEGIRRSRAGFDEADAGFLAALDALKAITLARGTLDDRWTQMQETIASLQTLVLAQTEELRAMREERRRRP